MSRRLGLAVLLLLAVIGSILPVSASPIERAIGAQASVVVRGAGATRFLVRFTVVRGVPGAGTGLGTALLSQVFRCSLTRRPVRRSGSPNRSRNCPKRLSPSAHSKERRRWRSFGRAPLSITWKPTGAPGPRPTQGDTLVADDGNAKIVYKNFRLANASGIIALLGGSGCRAPHPYVVTAAAAAATWQATTGEPHQPSPDAVPGLAATQGRCP